MLYEEVERVTEQAEKDAKWEGREESPILPENYGISLLFHRG